MDHAGNEGSTHSPEFFLPRDNGGRRPFEPAPPTFEASKSSDFRNSYLWKVMEETEYRLPPEPFLSLLLEKVLDGRDDVAIPALNGMFSEIPGLSAQQREDTAIWLVEFHRNYTKSSAAKGIAVRLVRQLRKVSIAPPEEVNPIVAESAAATGGEASPYGGLPHRDDLTGNFDIHDANRGLHEDHRTAGGAWGSDSVHDHYD